MSESIVVGTDGSDTAKRAVAEAVRLASALGAQLHVVSAYEPLRASAVAGGAKVRLPPEARVESTLAEAAAVARFSDVAVTTHAVRGDPADALMELAAEVEASLVVVGNQGMHGARRLLGSVPNSVSHKARCNVLIVATSAD